jgi:hypothetical protein
MTVFFIIGLMIYNQPAAGSEGDEFIQHFPIGKINWTQGIIETSGYEGPPPHYADRQLSAMTAALQQAQKNLYDILIDIQIDSFQSIWNLIQQDDRIHQRLKHIIKKSDIVDQTTFHDGSTKVTLQLKMQGALAQLVLPPQIKQIETVKPVLRSSPETLNTQDSPFTGMLIDAKGLKIRPVLAPTIYNESGQEIYGATFASREFAVQRGMVIYLQRVESEFLRRRIKGNPIRIKALRTKSSANCNLIVSDVDASIILDSSEHLAFLKQCRVVVLLDAPIQPKL